MDSKLFCALFCLLFSWVVAEAGNSGPKIFNVKDFGAAGNGKTDDSRALLKAWKGACNLEGTDEREVLIPEGTFLIGPVTLKGSCKGPMVVQVKGLVKAPELRKFNVDSDTWILFKEIHGFTLTGGGIFDGEGAKAWAFNNCSKNPECKHLPGSLKFTLVTDGTISNITSIDSKYFHMNVLESKNMTLVGLNITAPGDSPNTDGIHVSDSTGVSISDSVIGTGDDCVSIIAGNSDVSVSRVFCGPGHGISVGSLGKRNDETNVFGITVTNCTLTDTTNGLRIKTYQSSPVTISASNFTYTPSLVKIGDVHFRHVTGVSATKVAVKLLCSERFPCERVELSDIDLEFNGEGPTTSECTNVKPITSGRQVPPPCVNADLILASTLLPNSQTISSS